MGSHLMPQMLEDSALQAHSWLEPLFRMRRWEASRWCARRSHHDLCETLPRNAASMEAVLAGHGVTPFNSIS